VNEETEVRRAVAAEHGLNWQEAKFLTGETVPELEQSAAKLAALLGKQPEPEPELSFYERAQAEKAERKRTLLNALTGRLPQPRDAQGRYAKSSGFDGGRHGRVPPTPETHGQMLGRLLRTGEPNTGRSI
jgi:hypothetical protein